VNRNEYAVKGPQLRISATPGARYFDLWHGTELKPEVENGQAVLSFDLDPRGYGSILQISTAANDRLSHLLERMHQLAQSPLTSFSSEWHPLQQKIVEIPHTAVPQSTPSGMIQIPGTAYSFRASGIEIEGGNDVGVDVQYPWEDAPVRNHLHRVSIDPFFIDKHPVTNAQFKHFVDATKYHPNDDHNYLRHWQRGNYPEGWGNKPVVWISIEDARAYAAWAGKRLPHEWEWQLAAQGTDGRQYPWGNSWQAGAVPEPDQGRTMRPPDDVEAHPLGNSVAGPTDMVGLVWQWTDEYTDEHTRAAILKGGSYYQPQGSMWYFPQAYKVTEHGKYLLLAPGKDRSGTIGFRCVVDVH
jgi:formylglycine-generating enzyme required for sulfatase activity